jgi:hypothetical protein
MNRMLAGLALASAAALMAATPAQAAGTPAPAKPVTAVKKQLVPGKGVTFTERTTIDNGRTRAIFVRSSGTFQFSKSGLAASAITGKLNIKASDLGELSEESLFKSLTEPERTVRIGTTSYLSGSIWSQLLPSGKYWYKAPHGPPAGFTGMLGQPLNIIEPATLKTLFKNAKPATGGYTGKISVRDLRKVSAYYRASSPATPSAKALKAQLTWKLSVDAKGLPTRLVTTVPGSVMAVSESSREKMIVDTRYSGWGNKVSIKAPPADEITTKLEGDGGTEQESVENLDLFNLLK